MELDQPVLLRLSQVRVEEHPAKADGDSFGRLLEPPPAPTLAALIRADFAIPSRSVDSDEERQSATVVAGAHPAFDLSAYRAMESELADGHRGWNVPLLTALLPLPAIRFESGSHGSRPKLGIPSARRPGRSLAGK